MANACISRVTNLVILRSNLSTMQLGHSSIAFINCNQSINQIALVMTSFTAVLLILCLSAAAAFRYVPFSRQCVASTLKRQDFFQLKATQISSPDLELVTPSYRFAIGAAAVGSSLVVVAHNILGALPFLGLAGLLLVQTGNFNGLFLHCCWCLL